LKQIIVLIPAIMIFINELYILARKRHLFRLGKI
jgi:hypothetical protein